MAYGIPDDFRDLPLTVPEVIVDDWLRRIEYANQAKESFNAVAEACHSFFSKSGKFMWEAGFRKRFMGDIKPPRFETTVNAAFEFVAIFGPYLIWDYPHRTVRPYQPLELDPIMFGDDPANPFVDTMFQQAVQQQQIEQRRAAARCQLMERYLNYSAREQPQGLWMHSLLAVQDALVKGRGVLVPRAYTPPGSDRVLTGLFYESVDNLYIDPDCTDPLLETATWVAIRHQSPTYAVEDRFNLPRGTLAAAGNLETAESMVVNRRNVDQLHRVHGQTNDLICWYEIWSKCGIAGHSEMAKSDFAKQTDEAVGDYVYLAIAPGVPWLLNAPPEAFKDDTDEDAIAEMLGWPFPCFMDSKWPILLLDFYPDTDSPWPIAPLSAGLGHLITLNVLLAAYVEQAYENRKSIIAVLEGYAKDVLDKLSGRQNPAIVEIKADLEQDVGRVIQYLNRPNMNTDILQAIELELRLFARATGLVEFMYGAEAKVSRSAKDIAAKEEKTAIRPEKMSKDIAAWQTQAATLEAFLAILEVRGVDVMPHIPSALWEMLIVQQDPEQVMREMECVVEATDVRRPNRERDMSNLQILSQTETAMLQQYAADTGDTNPLNAFRRSIWRSMEQPFTAEMALGPWQPQPPPPEVQQQMQMEMQAEQMKAEAEQQKMAAEIQLKQLEMQFKERESQVKLEAEAQKAQIDAAKGVQSLEFDALKQRQGLLFDQLSHQQELSQDEQRHDVDLRQAEETGAAKVKLMRAQARAKPKANGAAKAKV